MITKEQAIDILDKFDFFQGQRAGRELWNDKPYEVQEEDIKAFSRDVAELKAYIDDVVPKREVEELQTENEELQAKVAKLRKENVELLVSKETDIHISMEKLVKARTEHPIFKAIEEKVAREIFDDIANIMVLQHGFNEKRIVAHIDFELLKELKKKYTENME